MCLRCAGCSYGLFVQTATEEGLLYPSTAAAYLEDGLPMVEFLGRIVGKALYEGILLEYPFAPLFVSKLMGRYAFLDELSHLDAELYRNLMYLKVRRRPSPNAASRGAQGSRVLAERRCARHSVGRPLRVPEPLNAGSGGQTPDPCAWPCSTTRGMRRTWRWTSQ